MIDDEQGLREARPHGVAEPEDRSDIDGLAAFTTNKPAVTVVVKRRRGSTELHSGHDGAQVVRVLHGGTLPEERRPRVYQVRTSASATAPAGPQPAAAVELDNRQDDEPNPNAVVETSPTRRRRARRDPTHAPGEVTRTVFEAFPATPVTRQAESETPQPGFIEPAEVGYEQVMAELQQLREEIDLALGARRFRIG